MIRSLKLSGNPDAGFKGAGGHAEAGRRVRQAHAAGDRHDHQPPHRGWPDRCSQRGERHGHRGSHQEPRVRPPGVRIAREITDRHIQSDPLFTSRTQALTHVQRQGQYGAALIDPAATSDAVNGFQRDLVIWSANHPQATDQERVSARNEILQRYQQQLDGYKMGEDYKRGAIQPQAAQHSRSTRPGCPPKTSSGPLGPNPGTVTSPRITPRPNQKTK